MPAVLNSKPNYVFIFNHCFPFIIAVFISTYVRKLMLHMSRYTRRRCKDSPFIILKYTIDK